MKIGFSVVILFIVFASVQSQMGCGGQCVSYIEGLNFPYGYGLCGLCGPPAPNVNPNLISVSDDFLQRIAVRVQRIYNYSYKRTEALNIWREAGANFQRCVDDYDTYAINAMEQYRSCLAINYHAANEKLRNLEMGNRPNDLIAYAQPPKPVTPHPPNSGN